MKLHLPTRLRAAVLACFAVVTSFTTTLATGVLAGGAFVVTAAALVAPQASAASFDSITWGGDFFPTAYRFSFVLDDVLVNGSTVAAFWGSSPTVDYGANGFTLVDNGDGTYGLKLDDGKLNNTNIDASTALTSNRGTTFEGLVLQKGVVYTVTADGITGADNGAKATVTAVGTGVSHESGTYKSNMNGSGGTHDKVNDAYAVSGATALVWDGTGDSADMTAFKTALGTAATGVDANSVLYFDASEGVAKTVNISGDVTVGSVRLYDNYTISAAEAANIAAADGITVVGDKTMTLSAADSNSSANTISAPFSGKLAVAGGNWEISGAVNASSIAVNKGSLTLSGAVDLTSLTFAATDGDTVEIAAAGALTFADTASINLGNLTAGTTYKIFDLVSGAALNGWDTLTAEQFIVNGAALNSSVYEVLLQNGTFTYNQLISSLTWDGGASGVWNHSDICWDANGTDIAFGNDVDVVFNNSASVEVQEVINVRKLTVASGNTLSLSAAESAALKANSVDIQGNLESALGIALSGDVIMADSSHWNLLSGAEQVLTQAQFANVKNMEIQNGASLALNSITTGQNGTVNASQLSGAGKVILKLRGDNGVNFNLSNFAGNIRVEKADGHDSARLQVNGSTFHADSTITLQTNGDLVFNGSGTVLSNDVSAEGVTKFFVNDGKSATINSDLSGAGTITKTADGTLTLNGTVTVSEFISERGTTNISGGSVTTLRTTGGTVNVNGGVVTSLNVRGGTVNLGDASGTHIWVGGRATVNVIGDYTASQLRMSEQNTSTVNIKDGGSLTITGSENGHNTNRSILLAHWEHNSTLHMEGGSLTATDAVLFPSWTGTGTFKATAGTATLKGISFYDQSYSAYSAKGQFLLGDASSGTARVNIGSEGISHVNGTSVVVNLGNGTLGATDDWAMRFENGQTSANVQLVGTAGGTVFDTMGHTVTVNTTLGGDGKLVKEGEGTLNLTGTVTCTGSIVAKAGTLSISSTGTNMIGAMEIDNGAVVSVVNPSLTAPIVNKGSLTLTGTLSVADLSAFTPSGTVSYVDASDNSAVSGYMAGERVYTLIENTGTLNDSGITSAKGVYANGKLTVSTVDDTVFYVNTNPSTGLPDEVTAVNLGAGRKYCMNGGYLTIDSSVIDDSAEGDEVAGILLGTVGDEGRMVLTAATTLGNNSTTLAGCELEVSGVQLTLGTGQTQNVDLSSFDKVVLNDGGKIQYEATGNSTFNNLTVESGVGEFYSKDTDGGIIQFDGVTSVGEQTITVDGEETKVPATLKFAANWNTKMNVEQLSGAGNVEVYSGDNNGENDTFNLTIDSLTGFSGKLSFTKDTGAPFNELTVNTGTEAVSMKGVSAASTGGSHAALALILNVQGNATLSEGLSLSNTEGGNGVTVTANIASGASLTSDLVVTGSDNTFNLIGGNLGGDIVLEHGAALTTALTATGELQVKQDATLTVNAEKTVTVTGASKTNNGTLTKEGAGALDVTGSSTTAVFGNLKVQNGTVNLTASSVSIGNGDTGNAKGLYIKGDTAVNIGNGTAATTVTTNSLEMGDNYTGSGGTLNVKALSTMVVTGADVMEDYHNTAMIFGEYYTSSEVNIDGRLLAQTASVTYGNAAATVNVRNGGVLAVKGLIHHDKSGGSALNLNLEDGGKVIVGSNGLQANALVATLGAGQIGITEDSAITRDITLNSAVGTTFNTAKYVWASDGANISEGTEGGTLTVSGVLSGSGKLVKTGAGTLKLTATNTYGGGTNLTGGTLEIAAESALGSGALSIIGGILDVTGNVTLGSTVSTTVTGGSLKASHADGWTLTSASVGGAAVSADSAGKVTMTNTTATGNITGNDKLVLAGTVNATANATVSGASVGGITVTTTDANKLTLNNTTIGSTITNNGALEFSGTQNVTLAGSSTTKYADVYGSNTYGDNGYKSTVDVYTLVSGTAATAVVDTSWQVNGVALSGTPTFDGKVLTHITGDAAGKVYYINSGTVVYETGAGCTEAEKLQFNGGKLELKTELAANKLSMGTGAAAVLMGDGTLNMGTGTALASGISLGTDTDAKWAGTVKVTGAALSDANLGALGVTGSTIELDDTDGTLKGGTYAAAVELTNGSAVVLGSNNSFASLDATGGSLSIAGVGNRITTLTMANNATLELNLSKMGVKDLGNWNAGPMLTVTTLDTATPGSKLNVSALVSQEAMLTLANGRSKVLATITNCNAALDALKLNGLEEQVLTGIGGMEYKYTLERVDGTNEVNLIVKASNGKDGWVAADSDPNSIADTTWTDADKVDDGKWAGVVGSFYGKGNATVHIEEDGVTMDAVDANGNPIGVIVSADSNLDVSEYTFTGGMLNTALLAVNQGGLVLDNAGVNAGMYVILSNDANLTVNADTVLTVGTEQGADEGAGMMGSFVSVGGKAKLINEGTTTIHGTLSVADTAAVSNSGILTVDAVSAEGSTIHNTGTFIVAGGGIIGKLTGEGALENVGQLSVLSDTTLGSLTNSGTLSVSGNLAVNSAVTQGGTVTATNVTVNGDAAFTALTTGKLTADSLTVKDATITTLDTDKLTVTDKGMVMVSSAATLSSLSNKGSLEVVGNLAVNSAVTQGGTVTATNVTVNGDAAFTALTTGKLTADSLTVKDATITTLDTDKLTVGGGTVAVTDDVTLAALSGSGTLNAVGKVSLTSSVDTKVNVSAAEIELADGGNSLGSLCTDAITMPEGSKLSTESALLTVDSVDALSGAAIGIDVSESAFAALDMLADGRYVAGNYLLIDGADSAAMFTYVNGQHLDAIIATGMNAGLAVNNGTLSLSVSEITNEAGEVVGMVWDTTNGNTTTNNGVGIDTDAGFYKALDYVKQVLVTEDVTFDLSADSVGDSVAGNTSDPVSGLLIRNLSGSGELTIKGNAAAQDVATLMNTPGREISAVGLTADAATVNLGLPKGAEGYLLSDLSSTGPTLKSLNLLNRSVVNVNSNTEVLGDTDVADYTRLSVKEGNMLTTGMLSGTDEAEISGVITVRKGGVYTGSYDEATLVADSGSNLRLRTGARRGMSLQVNADGQVTLDSAAQDGSMDNLRVGESPMARAMSVGSATLNLLNTAVTDDGINHSTITLTEDEGNYINKSVVTLSLGAAETARTLSSPGSPVVIDGMVDVLNSSITVNMLGNSVKNGVLEVNTESDKNLTLARFVTGGNVEGNTVTLTGTPEMKALLEKYYTNARLDSKGNIKVDRVTDYYGSRMQLSDNARVGIDMADAALVKLNPQANRGSYKDLADVLDTLDTAVATGNKQSADELGAAVSGASVAAMGAAVAGDVERQLMGIRNRTTTMGVDQTQVNENMPYFNAWINAEGDFRRMDEDGTAAGYELSSWGGTVGFDVDMTSRLTMGLAATAMYGDFTAKSADHAEGDLDTYYVTAFARYAANRWSHTFVATAGMADTSLKRTVSHAGGSYSTEGDAEAVSFGFLYELGYVVAMNESATACLQPVFNVMLSHSSLDGYSEEGSDAALKMGGVDMTTVTFGMGARAQAIVGANLYNRSSMVEGRALLKVRTGDTEAEAENALGAVPGAMGSVKAAEMGSIGAELGVGITVPMGSDGGSIFADASLEVGSGYTNINGTVGYRINF